MGPLQLVVCVPFGDLVALVIFLALLFGVRQLGLWVHPAVQLCVVLRPVLL